MSEYTPSMDHVRNKYARIMKTDGTPALAISRQKEFDRAIAAHDRALREQIAREIEERREHFIAETTLGHTPDWAITYSYGLDSAAMIARGKDQTDE